MESRQGLSSSASDKKRFDRIIFLSVAMLFSVYFTQTRFILNQEYERATFDAILDYSAALPFQCRILVPWVVNGLSSILLPSSAIDSPVPLFMIVDLLSVFSLVIVFRWYVSIFFKNYIASAILALSILYVLPFNYLLPRINAFLYPSDIPAVVFFCLGLIFLYKQNWLRYYLLFVIATLNRETTCFLTILFLITAVGKTRPNRIALHCIAQFIIWIAIKILLARIFIDNPGEALFEKHFADNLVFLMNFGNYPYLLSSMGFIWIPTLFLYRLIPDDFVRRSIFIIIPFLLVTIYGANVFELRIFGEMIPVFLMAFLLVLSEVFSRLYDKKTAYDLRPNYGRKRTRD